MLPADLAHLNAVVFSQRYGLFGHLAVLDEGMEGEHEIRLHHAKDDPQSSAGGIFELLVEGKRHPVDTSGLAQRTDLSGKHPALGVCDKKPRPVLLPQGSKLAPDGVDVRPLLRSDY